MPATVEVEIPPDLDWVQLRKDMDKVLQSETFREKMFRKMYENPFVPVGCFATLLALAVGLWSFKQGDRQMSQYMMRTRVVAQGFTIMALVVGLGISASRNND